VKEVLLAKKNCINCGLLISKDERICNLCHHDQDEPVTKKYLDILLAVNSAFYILYDPERHQILKNIANDLSLDNNHINAVYKQLVFVDLSLLYNLFLFRFDNHPKFDDIVITLQDAVENLLTVLFKEGNIEDIAAFFYLRAVQIKKAFTSQDPINALSKMLQLIILKICNDEDKAMPKTMMSEDFYMAAEMFAPPSIHQFTRCANFIGNAIMFYETVFNKWEIK
jgi:hypothetical protein